ncbi:transglutaminase-like domain-containing protein [Paraconexibacter algicola]|uniref:Transglutaminase n=1 Tax=Paraconexibacter algicola TaxID=2133960 RepID=A0A2T4UK31_9ACTN|nr:transglutaminase-like domain-containing protein [Paraconexibacter algicola]PTL59575.1 transglutaminase [Paraconexibacter algicola]
MSAASRPGVEDVVVTSFLDHDHPAVGEAVSAAVSGADGDAATLSAWFAAVRDAIRYDPYRLPTSPEEYRASSVLAERRAYCVPKAVLFAAGCRALGFPARLGYADVRNHLQTERLREAMGTDLFRYHGYAAVWNQGRWVKASPAFNRELCARAGVEPLDFDGEHDALMHAFTGDGQRYMEYVVDHGLRSDLPLDEILTAYREAYPALVAFEGER